MQEEISVHKTIELNEFVWNSHTYGGSVKTLQFNWTH